MVTCAFERRPAAGGTSKRGRGGPGGSVWAQTPAGRRPAPFPCRKSGTHCGSSPPPRGRARAGPGALHVPPFPRCGCPTAAGTGRKGEDRAPKIPRNLGSGDSRRPRPAGIPPPRNPPPLGASPRVPAGSRGGLVAGLPQWAPDRGTETARGGVPREVGPEPSLRDPPDPVSTFPPPPVGAPPRTGGTLVLDPPSNTNRRGAVRSPRGRRGSHSARDGARRGRERAGAGGGAGGARGGP